MKKSQTDKRQQILAAALNLFKHTHDIRKVSLEEIARQAGVSPTTIYNQFGSRETLVREVARLLIEQTLGRNTALVRSERPFPEKIALIMGDKVSLMEEVDREVINKMLGQDKTVAAFIDEVYQQHIKPLWREMLADGKRQGYVDPSLDENALLVFLDVMNRPAGHGEPIAAERAEPPDVLRLHEERYRPVRKGEKIEWPNHQSSSKT
jgi:AcrR family transcriptional regulator